MDREWRVDARGIRHRIHGLDCVRCRCLILMADDDEELVWEAGSRRDARCRRKRCICHLSPIRGDYHSHETHGWESHLTFRRRIGSFVEIAFTASDSDDE